MATSCCDGRIPVLFGFWIGSGCLIWERGNSVKSWRSFFAGIARSTAAIGQAIGQPAPMRGIYCTDTIPAVPAWVDARGDILTICADWQRTLDLISAVLLLIRPQGMRPDGGENSAGHFHLSAVLDTQ